MKILICGAGQVGWQIARQLSSENNDVTIIGNANNSTSVKVTFISQFSQKKGTATITKMNDSTLQWRIITKPKGEYYLPNQMVLKKQ